MKFILDKDINGFQEARKLKMLLEQHKHMDVVDKATQLFIDTLIHELDEFIASPEFEQFNATTPQLDTVYDFEEVGRGFFGNIYTFWRTLTGPTKRELILSNQRHELIERAERAESISFDSIAETSEIGRERDEVLAKLKALEIGNE
jgi:hypothetical protein